MIICVVLCIILSTTPVTASVQDNLNLALSKLIGQKNETTTQAAYGNASTNAKLNYLESRVRNIETTLGSISTSSGSVPQCVESGYFTEETTFTGPGVLYLSTYAGTPKTILDGVQCSSDTFLTFCEYNPSCYYLVIPFKNSAVVDSAGYGNVRGVSYTLYKY